MCSGTLRVCRSSARPGGRSPSHGLCGQNGSLLSLSEGQWCRRTEKERGPGMTQPHVPTRASLFRATSQMPAGKHEVLLHEPRSAACCWHCIRERNCNHKSLGELLCHNFNVLVAYSTQHIQFDLQTSLLLHADLMQRTL